ncbi:hypothetical protein [Helicobacter sp. T3_23-1059]
MGFEIFGMRVFDFAKPFGYFEVFSAIFFVCAVAFAGYLILAYSAKKHHKNR